MKHFLLICLVTMVALMQTVLADPPCSKNAWVRINPDKKNGNFISGRFTITSGQDAWDISEAALASAFNLCFFERGSCYVDKGSGTFGCHTTYEWKSANWVGTGNIEFNCGGAKLHHCYDVQWSPT